MHYQTIYSSRALKIQGVVTLISKLKKIFN